MTYEEAMKEVRAGKRVRHPKMGSVWSVMLIGDQPRAVRFGFDHSLNFALTPEDRAHKDWEVVEQ